MAESEPSNTAGGPAVRTDHMILIVVGAHLRAEIADRPLAYRLRELIHHWLKEHRELLNVEVEPQVCTDVWYINHQPLQKRPTISLGGPGVNALSAYFSQNLPPAALQDKQVVLQLDPEFVDLRVCLWGMNHEQTANALDVFVRRFLDGYLRAVVTQVEPQEE